LKLSTLDVEAEDIFVCKRERLGWDMSTGKALDGFSAQLTPAFVVRQGVRRILEPLKTGVAFPNIVPSGTSDEYGTSRDSQFQVDPSSDSAAQQYELCGAPSPEKRLYPPNMYRSLPIETIVGSILPWTGPPWISANHHSW
jgi:hypothetical protein